MASSQDVSSEFQTATKSDAEPRPGEINPEDEATGFRLVVIITALCLCTVLVGLDFTIIATAIPVITSQFNSLDDVGWYGSAFYIALCACQPLAGKLFLLWSKKMVLLCYIIVFEVGSLVCALAPTSLALIVGRAIAGLGASGLFAGSMVIISSITPLAKRPLFTGAITSTFGIASIIGPVIGGAFTQHSTWRWCFYVNLPIGGFSAGLIVLFLRLKTPSNSSRTSFTAKIQTLDLPGFAIFSGAVIMLLIPLQWGGIEEHPWSSATVIGLFVGAGLASLIFVLWQIARGDEALIPPRIFRERNVVLAFVSALAANGPFQTIVYYLPIWFQAVLAASPSQSGVMYLPTVIADVLTCIVGSGIVIKVGYWNPFLLTGVALLAVGAGLFTTLAPYTNEGRWIGYQILCGIGYSFLCNLPHIAMQSSLTNDLVPIGSTTLVFGMSLSCAVFLAVGQAIFQTELTQQLAQTFPEQDIATILAAGASQAQTIVEGPQKSAVVNAYNSAVTDVFFIPTAGAIVSFLVLCGTKWTSIKKPSTDSEEKPPA